MSDGNPRGGPDSGAVGVQATRGTTTPWWNTGLASRILSIVLALGTGIVLAIAVWLEPSAEGHGTHLQLGLNSCSILAATGYPCPMCGMTTTFALMAEGSWLRAIANQPFGVVLFLGTVGTFAISLVEIVDPRQRWQRIWGRVAPREGWIAGLFLLGLFLGWLYKIQVMR